ncbi:hypothetical protein [Bdellovibrio sp. HCB209]|uniref:hypothetical protein n=1 Tax=Bdellovibrio sp. HCB209 TaxID=3394354 RepID=UPI0039B49A5A
MGFKENKLEIAMVVAAVALVGGLGNLFKAPVQKALGTEFSFEMIRPKSVLAALFDLGGREVARSYVNPFGNPKAATTTTPNTEDKTQKAAATTAKNDAKKAADKKAEEDKKAKTDISVVNSDDSRKVGGDDLTTSNGSGGQSVGANNADGDKNSSDSEKDKDKMTAQQWRNLVLGQPTKENVNKMVLAYMDADLTDGEFFGIVKELLLNSNAETQSLGLSAASSFYSSTAFNTVASTYKTLSTDTQTKAMAYLLGFANAGRLGALASSLQSSNADVVTLAAEIVVKGYNSAKSGANTSQGSGRTRGDAFTNSLTSYSQFQKIFENLKDSSDAAIQTAANNALSQIQFGVASL